jgi:hypothetical protein
MGIPDSIFPGNALEDEPLGYVRDRILKDRLSYWCTTLDAEAI